LHKIYIDKTDPLQKRERKNYKRYSTIVIEATYRNSFDGDKLVAVKNDDRASRGLTYRSAYFHGRWRDPTIVTVRRGVYEVLVEWEGNFLRAKISTPNGIKPPFSL
jgi:hypothetical protein